MGGVRAYDHAAERASARAALRWWLDSGVDTPIAPAPVSWLQPPAPAFVPPPAAKPASTARAPAAPNPAPPGPAPDAPAEDWSAHTTLAALQAALAAHPFHDGDPASGLMLIGEGPSAEDLRTRRPFSGPAGDLLDLMLAAIGRSRASAYITNLCARRAVPGTPTEGCVAWDLPLARRHIALARPRALLILGAVPAQALTGDRTPVTRLRGGWFDLDLDGVAVPALVTFNPAYLLRRPLAKREAWADLRALKKRLDP